MSLTSQLKRKEIYTEFQSVFQIPKIPNNIDLVCSPVTNHYALVGTAFDYLLRFFIKKNNPSSVTKDWVAENSLLKIEDDSKKHSVVKAIISDAKEEYQRYLSEGVITDELLSVTLKLAKIDSIYRSGYFDPDIDKVDSGDIIDLKNLIKIVDINHFKSKNICLLNPTFGKASAMVGGADADIVIDDTLIDIKTTKYFSLKNKDYYQLIGYYILSQIGKIDGEDEKVQINNVAIYFSRHGKLVSFPVRKDNKIFGLSKVDFDNFLDWFKKNVLIFNFEELETDFEDTPLKSFAKQFMKDDDFLQPITIKRKIPIFEKKKGITKKLKNIIGYKIFYYHTNLITDKKVDIKEYGDELLRKRLTKQQLDFIFGDLKSKYKNTDSWKNWMNKRIK